MNTPKPQRIDTPTTLICLFFAIILLSPFGPFQILNFGGSYLAEIAFIFLLITLATKRALRKSLRTALKNKTFVWCAYVITLLFVVGLGFHGDFLSAYSDLRAHLVFLVCFCYFKNVKTYERERAEEILLVLSFTSLALYLLYLKIYGSPGGTVKYAYPAAAYITVLLFALRRRGLVTFIVALALATACAVSSFYRGQWILAALAAILAIIAYIKAVDGEVLLRAVAGFFITMLIIIFASGTIVELVNSYFQSSESAYIHSIGKTQGMIDTVTHGSLQGGDDIRASYFQYIADNFLLLLLPAGLGYDVQIDNVHSILAPSLLAGTTLDSFLLFSLVHYGAFSVPLGIALGFGLIRSAKRTGMAFMLIFSLWLLIYASIAAAFVTEISFAFFFAALLGLVMNQEFSFRKPHRCR